MDNNACVEKTQQTFTDLLFKIETTVKNLLAYEDHSSPEVFESLSFIQKQSRYADNTVVHQLLIDKIVRSGIGHVFLKLWETLKKESIDAVETDSTPNTQTTWEDGGSEESTEKFKRLQLLLSIIWNCTDSSASLCEALVRSACINHIFVELSQATSIHTIPPFIQTQKATKQIYLFKAYLGILHNIIRHCSHSKSIFKTVGAVDCLMPFLKTPDDVLKAKAYLLLSYLVSEQPAMQSNEPHSNVLAMADHVAAFIVSILRDALFSNNHFSARYAFWACEVAHGINHLAMVDHNKVVLGRLGVLHLYARMLAASKTEECVVAASGVWLLCFHSSNQQLLRRETSLLHTFRTVAAESEQEGVRRSLRGALWVLQSSMPLSVPKSEGEQQHVMISYHWSRQECMLRLRQCLVQRGYKVWFDVDNMRGSTLEAMALAVERSAVMLMAVCQEYKESANCRTEAEYAFRLRKDIIPLITQRDFSPEGWLGILLGTKLYFDFSAASTEELFEVQVERLVREIGQRGRKVHTTNMPSGMSALKQTDSHAGDSESSPSRLSTPNQPKLLFSPTPLHGYVVSAAATTSDSGGGNGGSGDSGGSGGSGVGDVRSWSSERVKNWLAETSLSHLSHKFNGYTGGNMVELRRIQNTAPEFFYNCLLNHLHLHLIDILNLSSLMYLFDV